MVRLADPLTGAPAKGVRIQRARQLTSNEVLAEPTSVGGVDYPGGPLEILVNNTDLPGTDRPDFTPITLGGITTYYSELPREGETEVWEIVEPDRRRPPDPPPPGPVPADEPPALRRRRVQRGIRERRSPAGHTGPGCGPPLDYQRGNPRALGGNPDVVTVPQRQGAAAGGERGRLEGHGRHAARPRSRVSSCAGRPPTCRRTHTRATRSYPFDPGGKHGYVWHCHIIDHEDNEMMRPTHVRRNPAAVRRYVEGRDY